MPKVGDRVIIEGSKIGQQRREGSLVGITGRLLNVRWNDGTTSLLTPGAGAITFLPSKGKPGGSTGAKRSPAKKAAPKKATTKKTTAKKPAGRPQKKSKKK